LLLGTVGWQRADWLNDYYPADLPVEWRLAYYANDCGCVLLPPNIWCPAEDAAADSLAEALQEAPESLWLFLEAPLPPTPRTRRCLEAFPPDRTVLLVAAVDPAYGDYRQWTAQGPGVWVDTVSGARLRCWRVDAIDLRELRARAGRLERGVQALVLDGPGADPGRVPELRTLLELLDGA